MCPGSGSVASLLGSAVTRGCESDPAQRALHVLRELHPTSGISGRGRFAAPTRAAQRSPTVPHGSGACPARHLTSCGLPQDRDLRELLHKHLQARAAHKHRARPSPRARPSLARGHGTQRADVPEALGQTLGTRRGRAWGADAVRSLLQHAARTEDELTRWALAEMDPDLLRKAYNLSAQVATLVPTASHFFLKMLPVLFRSVRAPRAAWWRGRAATQPAQPVRPRGGARAALLTAAAAQESLDTGLCLCCLLGLGSAAGFLLEQGARAGAQLQGAARTLPPVLPARAAPAPGRARCGDVLTRPCARGQVCKRRCCLRARCGGGWRSGAAPPCNTLNNDLRRMACLLPTECWVSTRPRTLWCGAVTRRARDRCLRSSCRGRRRCTWCAPC